MYIFQNKLELDNSAFSQQLDKKDPYNSVDNFGDIITHQLQKNINIFRYILSAFAKPF